MFILVLAHDNYYSHTRKSAIPTRAVSQRVQQLFPSRSILTDLIHNAHKDEKVSDNLIQQYMVGKSLRSQVEETKKIMTAVILFKCGQSVLDGKVLEIVEEK